MNINLFSIVILASLVLQFVLGLVAGLLNVRALSVRVPPELAGIYAAEEYRKSQAYLRTQTYFGLVRSSFTLAILLAFWLGGGFDLLDRIARAPDLALVLTGLIYVGALLVSYYLINLPAGIFETFVIEKRFGFNRTTSSTFILDQIKGFGLMVVIGGPLLAGVLALFQYFGSFAWLYCWAAVSAFSLVLQYVAPTWIMPLFNKFVPMQSGELKEAILGYAQSVEFPVSNVFVMDGSKRSNKANAFFTGFGQSKRIALFDTLIAKHTIPEMVAVVAHEVGHYKKKHILQGTVLGIVHTGVLFFLLSLLVGSPGLYQAFNMSHQSIYAGLVFFGLLYTPLELVLSIIMQIVSRRHEYEADRFAAETIDDPHSLKDALKKLSATNLSNLTPHPLYVFLNYSHPPLLQRLQAIPDVKRAD